jgi:hypothetical protein
MRFFQVLSCLRHVQIGTSVGPRLRRETNLHIWCLASIPTLRTVTIQLQCVRDQTWSPIKGVATGGKGYSEAHHLRVLPRLKSAWGLRLSLREEFSKKGMDVDVRCIYYNNEPFVRWPKSPVQRLVYTGDNLLLVPPELDDEKDSEVASSHDEAMLKLQ